jgi:hypothetical protein
VFDHNWRRRSPYRLPDLVWQATLNRVRSEFEEMPSLRVTLNQAKRLFGLPEPASAWVLRNSQTRGFSYARLAVIAARVEQRLLPDLPSQSPGHHIRRAHSRPT